MKFEWIESQCSKRIIEKGRQIADKAKVFNFGDTYRVLCPRARITFSVCISENSYSCSCELNKPCAHIAAAAIAVSSQKLSDPDDYWWVKYELVSRGTNLLLTRFLQHKDQTKAATFSNMRHSDVMVTELDKKVEILLQGRFQAVPTKNTLKSIFELFESDGRTSVVFDGQELPISSEVLLPIGIVEDNGESFNVCIRRHPNISAVFSNAVVCDGCLRITSRGDLSDIQFQRLSSGIEYNLDDVELLVCQVIPSLEEKVHVQILTERLPKALSVQPYLLIDSEQNGRELILKPRIAYGEPMVAWVRGDHLEVEGEYVPIRKVKDEKRIRKRAVDHLPIPMGADTRLSGERAVAFAEQLAELVACRKDWKMSGPVVDSFKRVEALVPTIEIKEDDLEVDWGPASKDSVLEAWRSGASLVQLDSGGWAPIPSDWLAQYGHLIADLLSARSASSDKKVPNFALFDLARLCDALNAPAPPKLAALKSALNDFEGLPPLERPKDLRAQLRNYQVEGVRWLQFLRTAQIGGILADDMGLGKTLQALCIIRKRSLVVAPTSVIYNWCLEVEKFRPELSVCLYHGSSRQLDLNADIIVTSYAIVRNDVRKMAEVDWSTIILDEAQAIKNPNSQTAQAIFSLQGEMKLALTGTPIENRLQELWSLFHFLCPGLLQGLSEFRARYELPISKGSAVAAQQLRQRIRPFVLRRMKKEVAPELPPRTNIVLRCTLSERERRLYEAIRISTQKKS
ncbi:MAG: DEAD/DEAH box helicase [Myxococcota bacterium]